MSFKQTLLTLFVFCLAEETEDDEVAAAGYEIYFTGALKDEHVPKLNDTSFNTTVQLYDIAVVFFSLPCKSPINTNIPDGPTKYHSFIHCA